MLFPEKVSRFVLYKEGKIYSLKPLCKTALLENTKEPYFHSVKSAWPRNYEHITFILISYHCFPSLSIHIHSYKRKLLSEPGSILIYPLTIILQFLQWGWQHKSSTKPRSFSALILSRLQKNAYFIPLGYDHCYSAMTIGSTSQYITLYAELQSRLH